MEYILCHAGIKGMRWGVRRYQNKDGSLTPAGKKRYGAMDEKRSEPKVSKFASYGVKGGPNGGPKVSKFASYGVKGSSTKNRVEPHEDYTKAHDSKSVKYMSDAELRSRNNRLQMERQYSSLTKKTNYGKKVITAVIATAGTITALDAAYKTYKKYGNLALDKIGDMVVSGIDLKGHMS